MTNASISESPPLAVQSDLSDCAREQIHLPSAIQPHGALLACRLPGRVVEYASDNLGSMFGIDASAAIGRVADPLFCSDSAQASGLVSASVRPREESPLRLIAANGRPFDAVLHRASQELLVIELEPPVASVGFHPRLRRSVARLQTCQTLDELFSVAAEEIRALTGFDRVLVHRFEQDWSGQVVAESKRSQGESFLGLHFPASDIPEQARKLYMANWLRFVGDVDDRPVPLVCKAGGEPLDMSFCVLRSLSPVHCQYLRNMGVRASMSISLVLDDRLWGLIVCHHLSGPRIVDHTVRESSEFLGQVLSWHIASRVRQEAAERDLRTKAIEGKLLRAYASGRGGAGSLASSELLGLTEAAGAAVLIGNQLHTVGDTPDEPDLRQLIGALRWPSSSEVFVTDRLSEQMTMPPELAQRASGVLAVALDRHRGDCVVWFRPSVDRVVDWAGEPDKHERDQLRGTPLSPRSSFALWKKTLRGRSEPWQSFQVEAAASLRALVLEGAQRHAAELQELNEHLLAEMARRRVVEEALHSIILSHVGSAIFACDPLGTITLFNRAAEVLLGYQAAELVGKASPVLLHDPAELDARRATLRSELGLALASPFEVFTASGRSGRPDVHEWTYLRKDGERVPVQLTVSALRDDKDAITGYVGIAVDLTQHKRDALELENINRLLAEQSLRADAANRAKSMFLANMSHEIRTPMGAIVGVTYLLAKSALPDDQQGLVATLERSSKTLLAMINDVLDLSKVEAGQLSLEAAPFLVSEVLEELGSLMHAYAAGKQLELVVDAEPSMVDALIGDRVRLVQVLTNLVGNAIKFTAQGAVRLHVLERREQSHAAERVWLTFEVEDTGRGMDAALLAKLFTPFTQGEHAALERIGGTGLGLALVKELVTMMGGSVAVESRAGQGSLFSCTLPFERVQTAPVAESGPTLSVLVVDDHEGQRLALVAHVTRAGWQASSASSAVQALAVLRERARLGRPIDAVVLDWKMPQIDGLQLLAALRDAQAGDFPQPSVVLMTAHDLSLLRAQPGAERAQALIVKPVAPAALRRAVTMAVAARSRQGGAGPSTRRPSASPRRLPGVRILLVDDSDVNRDIAQRILAREGALMATARDGQEAVELLAAGSGPYDVVLMDVQMPVMDGIEAARRIRQRVELATLPIIALTAGALATERQRALDVGMNDFVSKPFDPDSLITRVRAHVERFRSQPLAVLAAERPSPSSASSTPWPAIEGIDVEEAQARFEEDHAFFRDVLRRTMADLEELERSLAAQSVLADLADLAALAAHTHKLKGMAGNVCAHVLVGSAIALEQALAKQDASAIETAHDALLIELARLRRHVAAA